MLINLQSNLSSEYVSDNVTPDVVLSYALFLLFPVALLLNGVATVVSLHLRSSSTFVVYLKNLVAADLLVTLTLLPMAASMLPGASFGLRVFACRLSNVIFYSCLYTSIALMGLISLDRFFKTVRPHGNLLGKSVRFSVVASTSVWVVIFGSTAIPNIILTNQSPVSEAEDFCMSLKGPLGHWVHSFTVLFMEVVFWLVSLLISLCYIRITLRVLQTFRKSGSSNSRGMRKTTLRVFSILFVFLLCFVPFHVVRIPSLQNEVSGRYNCSGLWVKVLHNFCLWMSTTNICLDPLLYVCLCREYRNKLEDLKNRWLHRTNRVG